MAWPVLRQPQNDPPPPPPVAKQRSGPNCGWVLRCYYYCYWLLLLSLLRAPLLVLLNTLWCSIIAQRESWVVAIFCSQVPQRTQNMCPEQNPLRQKMLNVRCISQLLLPSQDRQQLACSTCNCHQPGRHCRPPLPIIEIINGRHVTANHHRLRSMVLSKNHSCRTMLPLCAPASNEILGVNGGPSRVA